MPSAAVFADRILFSDRPAALSMIPPPLRSRTLAAALFSVGSLAAAPDSYQASALPILERYCFDCHADGIKKGGFTLDSHRSLDELLADQDLWKRVRDQLDFGLMPPPDEDQPEREKRSALIEWIDDTVFPVDPNRPDPGHVTLRRLNRTEYRNTLRDLLGVELDVESLLPPDDSGYGFDNIGDTLTLSPAHLERYFDAAELALDSALHLGPMPRERRVVEGSRLRGDGGRHPDGRMLHTVGEARARFDIPRPGRYQVEITASGSYGADIAPHMELRIAGETVHAWEVHAPESSPAAHTHEITLEQAGEVRIAAAFTNDFYDETIEDPTRRDRNLIVAAITLTGPLDGPPPPKPESHRRIFGEEESRAQETPQERARRILSRFARQAFRRPPTETELQRHIDLALRREPAEIEAGIRDAMLALLVSPAFLFREEPVAAAADGAPRPIHEHALASRLSYFLWSSMPDEQLLDLADAGRLRESLPSEVHRMLASPRADALIHDFVGQWLQLRDLDVIAPDLKAYPEYNRALAADMRRETEELFRHLLRENLPLTTLLDADFTFVNQRLARHYGLDGVEGRDFRLVSLENTPRRGLLGHASILTLTSYPTRTSPVIRGKFILDNLLNTPPPPPPQNVPALETSAKDGENLALREQLERHRADPNCSSCHALMDPLGFGLENFDGIGRWRTREQGHEIDPSGELTDGTRFAGPEELLAILRRDQSDRFIRAAAAKMLTYALGRGLEYYDRPALDTLVSRTMENDGRIQALILAIVDSVPFQYRR
jgi:hypothetical protein